MIIVPEAFASAAITRAGENGRRWISELPHLVHTLCERWSLVVDGSPMHGHLGLVIPVTRDDEPCVLKVSWIDESTAGEATALAVWNGRGAVRLLESEPSLGAMLLERLDHTRSLCDLPVEEAVAVAGQLLRRLSVPAPDRMRTLQGLGERLSQTLPERWVRCGRPMPRRLVDRARDLATRLGERAAGLLVNYDLHYADVLRGERESWLVVDPKVVSGDPEFGIAQLLWRRLDDMEVESGVAHYFQLLTEAAELDPDLARAWTLVRCVDYWLWGLSIGLTEDPARCRLIIERVC